MGLKLSIIVPVYKVEQYLYKCVDSLLNQDLMHEEYEIILVDDGSPDGCPAICDGYAGKYENVKAIHRENGGATKADEKIYVQVTESMTSEDVRRRELSPLQKVKDNYEKTVLSLDPGLETSY